MPTTSLRRAELGISGYSTSLSDMRLDMKYVQRLRSKAPPLTLLNHGDFVKCITHKGQKSKTDGEI